MDDRLNPTQEPSALPEAPPNLAALAAGPFADGVHVRLKLNYDVNHLSEDRQKLLLHYTSQAVKKLEEQVKRMSSIEVASKLANLERVKNVKNNGNPESQSPIP